MTDAPWSSDKINERRLEVMNQCSQTKISRGFSLIVDDSGHRKSGCLLRPNTLRKPQRGRCAILQQELVVNILVKLDGHPYRFVEWLNHNRDLFIAYKASLDFIWA